MATESRPDLSALRIHREPERARRPAGILAGLAIAALAIGAGVFYLSRGAFATRSVETVSASVVTEGQASSVLSASGYVEADTKADLSPKITSKIVGLFVEEGDRVGKGKVLARLDSTDLDAQLADARAAWKNAAAELERQKALQKAGLAPVSAIDAAVAAEGSTRAKVRYVLAQEDYAVIRAPFAGVVVAKRAHVGEAVSPFGAPGQGSSNSGAIVTLVDFSTLYVGADVNESNLARLAPRQPAELTLDAYPDHVYRGHLLQIIPTADRSKGTVKVKVAFENPDAKILPEMSARVNFTEHPSADTARRSRVLVPKSAVVDLDGRRGVFVVAQGRARFHAVRTGAENGGQIEAVEGLKGGELLVAEPGKAGVRDGEKVKVKAE
jgi:RND family efflux transporter MFP subunit